MFQGKSGFIALLTFESTETIVLAALRSFKVSEAIAEQFAFEAALTASSLVATTCAILTQDVIGAIFAAGFIGFVVGGRLNKSRKRTH